MIQRILTCLILSVAIGTQARAQNSEKSKAINEVLGWNSLPGCEKDFWRAHNLPGYVVGGASDLTQMLYCGLSAVGIDATIQSMKDNGVRNYSSNLIFSLEGKVGKTEQNEYFLPYNVSIGTDGTAYVAASFAGKKYRKILSENIVLDSDLQVIVFKIDDGMTFANTRESSMAYLDGELELRMGKVQTHYVAVRVGGSPARTIDAFRVDGHHSQDQENGIMGISGGDAEYRGGLGYSRSGKGFTLNLDLNLVHNRLFSTDLSALTPEAKKYQEDLVAYNNGTLTVEPTYPKTLYNNYQRNSTYLLPSLDLSKSIGESGRRLGLSVQGQQVLGKDEVTTTFGQYYNMASRLRTPVRAKFYVNF